MASDLHPQRDERPSASPAPGADANASSAADANASAAASPRAARVTRALREAQRAGQDAHRAAAERLELGVSDLSAIDQLLRSPEPLGPVELGRRLGMRSASATTLVDRLERAGHLVRDADPSDRRRQALHVTDHARGTARAALGPMIDELQAAAAQLSDADADAVARYLEQAAAIMAAYAAGR